MTLLKQDPSAQRPCAKTMLGLPGMGHLQAKMVARSRAVAKAGHYTLSDELLIGRSAADHVGPNGSPSQYHARNTSTHPIMVHQLYGRIPATMVPTRAP